MAPIAVYHNNCQDGTAAAAVFLRKFPGATAIPLAHGAAAEEIGAALDAVFGDEPLYTLDCVIGVREALARGIPVIAIDHHIGIKDEMEALAAGNPALTFMFNAKKSGSSLAWEYFFPNKPMPRLIELTEDGDLWRFAYGDDTRHWGTFMMTRANQPESILPLFDTPIEPVLAEGKAMSALADAMVAQFKSFAKPVWVTLDSYTIPLYNNPHFDSRLGNDMSELHDCVSGVFDIRGDMVRLSFRSKDHHSPNALAIAKTLGGGGHPNAAGTQMPLPQFIACMNIK